ncbi:Signal transduction histidine kinase [Halorubrum aquaticum]|uniref:histidine kinase n=1 Tax=Halorubrum aquaticum TaxID=387340 RepID=A0A1I2ZMD2_9EURY|nr:HAMP domain-containing sensor histidine kinase [Halorubrum aquaticum]SFH38766.1 Signal transduction histidine kinase [Halorubrum aquaticum]
MDTSRLTGALVISFTGVGLAAIAVRGFTTGTTGVVDAVVTGVTLLFGVAFTLTGPIGYRADVESRHLLRIAGWNALGVVATSAVLVLVYSFQVAGGGNVVEPLVSGAIVVAVSAFAHVLIGFNDVRRIRARRLVKQRQKAAVMNRFVRHDLRHAAQLLIGYGEQLSADGGDEAGDERGPDHGLDLGRRITEIGSDLGNTQSQIRVFDDLLEGENDRRPVDLATVVDDERAEWEEEYPDGTLETDIDPTCTARAGEHLDTALGELIDNAFRYGGDPPSVTLRGTRTDGAVRVEILDDGDGFPDDEMALINEDRTETQLQHSSGLGLWLAKWVIEHYDGSLSIGDRSDGKGGVVTVRLPAADG